jgi:hypothetical protein
MSSGVGVHPQRLLRIIEAVQEELSPERQRPLVLSFHKPRVSTGNERSVPEVRSISSAVRDALVS